MIPHGIFTVVSHTGERRVFRRDKDRVWLLEDLDDTMFGAINRRRGGVDLLHAFRGDEKLAALCRFLSSLDSHVKAGRCTLVRAPLPEPLLPGQPEPKQESFCLTDRPDFDLAGLRPVVDTEGDVTRWEGARDGVSYTVFND